MVYVNANHMKTLGVNMVLKFLFVMTWCRLCIWLAIGIINFGDDTIVSCSWRCLCKCIIMGRGREGGEGDGYPIRVICMSFMLFWRAYHMSYHGMMRLQSWEKWLKKEPLHMEKRVPLHQRYVEWMAHHITSLIMTWYDKWHVGWWYDMITTYACLGDLCYAYCNNFWWTKTWRITLCVSWFS